MSYRGGVEPSHTSTVTPDTTAAIVTLVLVIVLGIVGFVFQMRNGLVKSQASSSRTGRTGGDVRPNELRLTPFDTPA